MSKRRIKILRIQSRICIGGPAIHTELLSRYLPKDKYETILLGGALEPGESSKFSQIKEKGVDIRIVKNMHREPDFWNDLRAVREVYKIIRQEKPTIVHTHTAKAGFIGRIAAWLAGVPIIIHTFHGHTFENYFGKVKTQFFILIERLLAKVTHRIVAISPSQKKDLVTKFRIASDQKVSVIRLGFELKKFLTLRKNGDFKKMLGIPNDQFLLAIIGRVVPIKNHRMALYVLQELLKKNHNIHLAIIGGGEDKNKVEKLATELDLKSHVHFTGWIEDIEKIYAGIDVLILTSLNEGTPVTIIEAMASSVPVIATNVGGVKDLLKDDDNGFLCEIDDVMGMAQHIINLQDKSELTSKVCSNAKRFVKDKYDYHRLVNDIDILFSSLYKNLIQNY